MSDLQFHEENHAKIYSLYRKDIPVEVVEKIISFIKEKYNGPLKLAVDVGCGSGQSTVNLAKYFTQVYGIDVSEAQVQQAKASRAASNLEYVVGPAESLQFASGSVQLLTVASALNWFELDKFFAEARRVLCPSGVLAVTGYRGMMILAEDPKVADQIDQAFEELYETLDPYTHPKARRMVEFYKNINCPFEEVVRAPTVRYIHNGCLADIVNYVKSFLSYQTCKKIDLQRAKNCIDRFQERLYGIAASLNIKPSDVTKLYEDFPLILCRK